MRTITLAAVTLLASLSAAPAALADADLFILRRGEQGLALERVHLAEGTEKSWTVGIDGFVDVIMPPAPGGSAGIIQSAMKPTTVARVRDGALSVVTTLGTKRFERPMPAPEELRRWDIHVSARSGDGTLLAAFIRGYERLEPDTVGVVEDPFGTLIPLQPNDCVINTTTFGARVRGAATVEGEVPVRLVRGHHLAHASIEGGRSGDLVIDLAAGATIISKSALPEGAVITPSETAEYSADGVRRLATEIGGATNAAAPLGVTTLTSLVVGSITYRAVEAIVMAELPPVGEGVIGILGIDLLTRSRAVSLPYPKDGEVGSMRLGASGPKGAAAVIPISVIGSRAYCQALVNDSPAVMIVDSGSPITIFDPRGAKALGVVADEAAGEARGIGSGTASLQIGTAKSIRLGEWTVEGSTVRIGSLPIFTRFQGSRPVGILGNDTLSRCGRVEVDFETATLRLYR